MSRIEGTIQKVSKNEYGWNATPRGIIVPTKNGDIDVSIPGNSWIGDNGNFYYTVILSPDGDLEVYSNEDYTYGNFPNSRRSSPEMTVVFRAEKAGECVWEITKNNLPKGYVKPSPPQQILGTVGAILLERITGVIMTNNTKARHLEILEAAKAIIEVWQEANKLDITQPVKVLPLAKEVQALTDCHIDTAKRNVAKAIRIARGEEVASWGGNREATQE